MEQVGRISKRRPKQPPVFNKIGEAFNYPDPIQALWLQLVREVFAGTMDTNLSRLTRPAQVLYLVDVLDREIRNGGFHQYFWNISGQYCEETKLALLELNASKFLALFERACAEFPDGIVPSDWNKRRVALCELSEESQIFLGELDSEFNKTIRAGYDFVENTENAVLLALTFMRKYPDEPISTQPS